MTKPLTHQEIARMGANTINTKYPRAERQKWAAKGGQATVEKHGTDHFRKIAQKSLEVRKAKRNRKPSLQEMLGIKRSEKGT